MCIENNKAAIKRMTRDMQAVMAEGVQTKPKKMPKPKPKTKAMPKQRPMAKKMPKAKAKPVIAKPLRFSLI